MQWRAIHNPFISAEGKEHAWNILQQTGDDEARQGLYHEEEKAKDPISVAAGLKA
jgi:hypothetical protein